MIIAPAGGSAGLFGLLSKIPPDACWGGADGEGEERDVACSAFAGLR